MLVLIFENADVYSGPKTRARPMRRIDSDKRLIGRRIRLLKLNLPVVGGDTRHG